MDVGVMETARELGQIVARAREILPELAMEVAQQACRGVIDEGRANEIYGVYAERAYGVADVRSGSFRANASKLRAIIRCAREHKNTPAMLDTLGELHRKEAKLHEVNPLYETMVWACRQRLAGKDVSLVDMQNQLRAPW
jgi:hypothetical protein